ncbi:CYIR protein [Plasmodium cynomolgi strain B]|uniref:CYIR protein n=1 Tax=Plasmodium cynomolgi (strain B) TaxID=1120755 RepID=K6V3I4_PLACD|nr:CYIR protein [Plasmodium cynomolgi strain B]GAB69930.1 CYIR protein [Plasmodium cynomolgi strain B]
MTDSVLDKLPSKVFYKELTGDRSDISDGKYSIVCESITTDSPKQGKINEICKKLRQNIYYLENVRKDDSSIFDKHCYDLNYWLYDELSKEPDESNTKNIHPFFEKIQVKWKNIKREEQPQNSGKICEPKSEPFKTGLFKCIKELLDYFENFQTFKTEMETEQTEMKKKEPNKYCEYIKKCVPLYFTFKQLCKLIKNEICTKYLQNNDSYDPTQLLSKLSCVEGGKYEVKLDDGLVKEMITTYQSNFGNLLTGFGNILPGFGSIIPGSLQGMFTNSIYNLMQKGFAEKLHPMRVYFTRKISKNMGYHLFLVLDVKSKYILKYVHFKKELIILIKYIQL